jgi:hypothetical protein
VESLKQMYGDRIPDIEEGARELLDELKDLSFEERFTVGSERLAGAFIKEALDKLERKAASWTEKQRKAVTIRDLFERYLKDPDLSRFGLGDDVDRVFKPFFERYGGSWEDFPAFHVDIHPDWRQRHQGGHSLVEMLVLVHFLTGDDRLREIALQVGRHHVKVLVPEIMERTRYSRRSRHGVFSRTISWPLINLVSLWDLTEGREPELHAKIVHGARLLAERMCEIRVEAHQGGIHAGVGTEALARYHSRTEDPAIARYLVRWARYWAATQWNPRRRQFQYIQDQREPAWPGMTGLVLYGLAYAQSLSPDPKLKRRVLEARDSVAEITSYAKSLGNLYRSTPQAMGIIESWGDRPD